MAVAAICMRLRACCALLVCLGEALSSSIDRRDGLRAGPFLGAVAATPTKWHVSKCSCVQCCCFRLNFLPQCRMLGALLMAVPAYARFVWSQRNGLGGLGGGGSVQIPTRCRDNLA